MKKRKSVRFKEKRINENRQCIVSFVQQFYPGKSYYGKLYDLSENAIKVLIDKTYERELFSYKPNPALMKFRFAESYKITVSVSRIVRIDMDLKRDDMIGVVLYFDFISKEDVSTIKEIISLYS